MEVPTHIVYDVLFTAANVGGFLAAQRDMKRRVAKIEAEYVPRPEIENSLAGIEKSVIQLHGLMEAFVSSGRRGLDLDAAAEPLAYIEDYVANDCPRFEASVPWMYLDSVGLVTCAVGNMLPDAAAACRLPFRDANGTLATSQQIAEDFARVHAMEKDKLPEHYHCSTSLTLLKADIVALNRQRCYAFDAELSACFHWFAGLPDKAKKAVLDMAFNLGVGRSGPPATGLHEYTHLIAALGMNPPNYMLAAAVCKRDAANPSFIARNEYTKDLFIAAGGGA